MRDRKISVMLGVPSMGMWNAEMATSFAMVMSELMMTPLPGTKGQSVRIASNRGSILIKSRTEIVREALDKNVDYLCWFDSDMVFPKHTVHTLFSRGKNIVAANCPTKTIPSQPTAHKKSSEYPWGEKVYTRPGSTGIERVWRIGTGVMLMNMSVFKHIKEPWFKMEYRRLQHPSLDHEWQTIGEDWYFCELLEKAGIDIYIDHDVSREIGHIGYFTYGHAHVREISRAEDEIQAEEEAA